MTRMKFAACFVVLLAGVTLAACTQTQTQERMQSLVERGDYLVNSIMTCNHCHTPKDKAGNPIMEQQFTGGAQRFDEVTFTATGPNITQDTETGIGQWSDAEIKRALTEGVSRNGRPLAQTMAQYRIYLKRLTDEDLQALVVWLRSLSPLE